MITKESFLQEFNGHSNWYSKYLVLTDDIDRLIKVLNNINPLMCVGSGSVNEDEKSISFEICKESPGLIYDMTKELQVKGFADTAWDNYYTIVAENGVDSEDYYAEWEAGSPYIRDDDDTIDSFINLIDPKTGVTFYSGAGAVDAETFAYYKDIVAGHKIPKVRFESGEEFLDALYNNHDYYNAEKSIFAYRYNEAGSIACFNVNEDEVAKLRMLAKSHGYGWAETISTCGTIYDDVSSEHYHKGDISNLEWCKENFCGKWEDVTPTGERD